jgi:hypothetical protein
MYSSFLEEGIVFDQSVSGKAIVNSDCEGHICCPSLDRESSQKRDDSLPKNGNVMKRIAIYALVVGLIFSFTQVAQGQQADPAQPPPAGAVAQNSSAYSYRRDSPAGVYGIRGSPSRDESFRAAISHAEIRH